MMDQMVGHCYDCQVTIQDRRQEPIKPSVIPKEPWEETSIDFGGPYPDGHYNLVVMAQRTRYPEVEIVFSIAIKSTKEKSKKIFAHRAYQNKYSPTMAGHSIQKNESDISESQS